MATTNKAFKVKNGLELGAIDLSISDSAVDVFVYDTSLDSDGGAWRKRTSHTSWYNETLNTSERGSRREFPAVALIVIESTTLKIYDADDPSMPLWFKDTGTVAHGYNFNHSCVTAMDGKIVIGLKQAGSYELGTYGGMLVMDFIGDYTDKYGGSGAAYGLGRSSLRDRSYSGDNLHDNNYRLIDGEINDVAITVLPNAAIQKTTGLPYATIAASTPDGTSVVIDMPHRNAAGQESPRIHDITHLTPHGDVVFMPNGDLFVHRAASTYYGYLIPASAYMAGDVSASNYIITVTTSDDDAGSDRFRATSRIEGAAQFGETGLAFKGPSSIGTGDSTRTGLGLVDWHDVNVHSEAGLALRNHVTKDYTTGWMPKDTFVALLADTDTTDISGSEVIDSASDLSVSAYPGDWSIGVGTATATSLGGLSFLKITPDGSNLGAGWWTVRFTVSATTTYGFYVDNGDGYVTGSFSAGTYTITFYNPSTGECKWVLPAGYSGTFSNISVRRGQPSYGASGVFNGVAVHGSITKSVVNTDAELVAYSGFSTSNYLRMPHNSNLNFGTGDFCVMFWGKTSPIDNQNCYFFDRGDSDGHSRIAIYVGGTSNTVTFYTTNSTGTTSYSANSHTFVDDVWHLYTMLRRDGRIHCFVDAKRIAEFGQPADLTNSDAPLIIGNRYNNVEPLDDSITLMRWSASAPTDEQIQKIFQDEKQLFKVGAKCTLYGSSDAIVALDYDKGTDQLHVGTSQGRSVFSRLRRVDYSTNGVGSAISAANGLVADE